MVHFKFLDSTVIFLLEYKIMPLFFHAKVATTAKRQHVKEKWSKQ